MRKIFFTIVLALMINAQVAAQDVWISSGGNGSEWYIMDETPEGDANGKFRWVNVDAKLVTGDSFQIVSWKFTQIKPDGGRLANWVYDIDWGDGKRYSDNEVLEGTNAEKILLYCLDRLRI